MAMNPKSLLADYFRLTPPQRDALKRLGLVTIEDLVYHFPTRYGDTVEAKNIDSLSKGDSAVIFGKISNLKASKGFRTKMTMASGYVEDETGKIQCVWFNQPYLAKMTPEGSFVRIEGRVSQRRLKAGARDQVPGTRNEIPNTRSLEPGAVGEPSSLVPKVSLPPHSQPHEPGALYFSNPKIEVVANLPIGVGDSLFGKDSEAHTLYPVYPESRGISSSWIYHTLQKIFKNGILEQIEEPIPQDILDKYNLPGIKTSLIWIHTPLKNDDAVAARKRFSFEEIFTIQLGKQKGRKEYESHPTFKIETSEKDVAEFIRRFPFTATDAQQRVINNILTYMKRDHAMSLLLEGDVGSGKTAVAAATAYSVMNSKPNGQNVGRLQVAYMCPTEILATQHFESFISYFSYMPIQIGLITSSGCRKFPSKINPKGWTDISRAQLLKWVESGDISVLVGTHSLIQKTVKFKNLAYVIIDEQHRFGTMQRAALVKKNQNMTQKKDSKVSYENNSSVPTAPHLLSMTATPIPRTLALTIYGDLDLAVLDQMPMGRKPIITEVVLPEGRNSTYEKVREELKSGRQVFVICPRIDEPDPDKEESLDARSVKEEAKRLKKDVFPEYEIGILHGKMKPVEKDNVMGKFKQNKIQILCATSVVEVGVNVPNATVIIIEGAERFGLAQLHQLRGRVMRSSHQAYCYAFTETTSQKSIDRLNALRTAKNGFELAELDLAARGSGTLGGKKQWGISDIAMEALKNIKMVEFARTEAMRLIDEDITLSKYPILKTRVEEHEKEAHFE